MKRQLVAGILALNMLIVGGGCAAENIESDNPDSNQSQSEKSEDDTKLGVEVETMQGEGITYEILTADYLLKEDLQTALTHVQMHKGFGIMKEEEDSLIVYVGLGEKPSAGYELEIENVVKKDDKIIITVKETEPPKDAMAAEMLTYPTKVIRLKDKTKNIEVVNNSGEIFEDINAENEE
ncbi:protease complex subunit PrcB family protein [Maledivibacter halophilus]|uniref:PrcB C-terminal n=1 Tax=Maledivibacter halophilus TaxID=36842 RepID=A0A1T5MDG6_9FIRM|nr:protease complex subunit PrcB family protein [Maledivibacter halophilus]SKC86276.1 PrcB C-terminal [Maledivibacter halophilus]